MEERLIRKEEECKLIDALLHGKFSPLLKAPPLPYLPEYRRKAKRRHYTWLDSELFPESSSFYLHTGALLLCLPWMVFWLWAEVRTTCQRTMCCWALMRVATRLLPERYQDSDNNLPLILVHKLSCSGYCSSTALGYTADHASHHANLLHSAFILQLKNWHLNTLSIDIFGFADRGTKHCTTSCLIQQTVTYPTRLVRISLEHSQWNSNDRTVRADYKTKHNACVVKSQGQL